ncbi:SDR family NAD(P)-dependent oxidoreductase [Novosphingobium album (ex Hu et al. 2023)]|uniref:SDR family oxidoreductase n=1 Tax=Novosphingobium album (ex Hu et al. 2023) TaxID=2930093 RepID=A0ABT0B7F7_9SPHN|nr:SDR family oxidoreductase [Novosphingobium album (ex Hu et al. 2023)]MCJ2181012.1 SDR family oxidoreductase [Novosphingobium album (ex Hu et al. 2023)]
MNGQRLHGKVALITGAGQGVGLGIAQAFCAQGAAVVITGRDAERLASAVEVIEARGGSVAACPGDAAKRENAKAAVALAIERFGGLDILVNNAQARRSGVPFEEITEADMDLALGSGPVATLLHMQEAFPHLKARGGGSIINFGSKMGMQPIPGIGSYAAAKEAIRALTRSAAREWGKHAIRVNTLTPASLGDSGKAYFKDRPDEFEKLCRDVALGHFGDAETEIGAVALFLACDDSRYVTGQTLNADGGQLML